MLTIPAFLAFARTKPADERYDYVDHHNCPIAQFLRATDVAEMPSVSPYQWHDIQNPALKGPVPHKLDRVIAMGNEPDPSRFWSWGQLVERLEAMS